MTKMELDSLRAEIKRLNQQGFNTNTLILHPIAYAWLDEWELWHMMDCCKMSFWQFLRRFA